jgi:hypothetical protein
MPLAPLVIRALRRIWYSAEKLDRSMPVLKNSQVSDRQMIFRGDPGGKRSMFEFVERQLDTEEKGPGDWREKVAAKR